MKLRELIWVINHGNTTDLGGDVGLHLCTLFLLAFKYWGRVSGKVLQAMQRYLAAGLGGTVGSIGPIVGVEGLPVLWRSRRHGEEWKREKDKASAGKIQIFIPGGGPSVSARCPPCILRIISRLYVPRILASTAEVKYKSLLSLLARVNPYGKPENHARNKRVGGTPDTPRHHSLAGDNSIAIWPSSR